MLLHSHFLSCGWDVTIIHALYFIYIYCVSSLSTAMVGALQFLNVCIYLIVDFEFGNLKCYFKINVFDAHLYTNGLTHLHM